MSVCCLPRRWRAFWMFPYGFLCYQNDIITVFNEYPNEKRRSADSLCTCLSAIANIIVFPLLPCSFHANAAREPEKIEAYRKFECASLLILSCTLSAKGAIRTVFGAHSTNIGVNSSETQNVSSAPIGFVHHHQHPHRHIHCRCTLLQ